jgi:hypothetical protein
MEGTNTDLSNLESMAKAQKYKYEKSPQGGLVFRLKVDDKEYNMTFYSNGRFAIMTNTEVLKGDWYASKWGLTVDYKRKNGEKVGTAGQGLNAMDASIGDGVLNKIKNVGSSYTALIKDINDKWVALIAKYEPKSAVCISPKSLKDIMDNKCILTVGSRGDITKLVQSMLNFVLSREALDLLKKSGFYSNEGLDAVSEMEIDADGKFGNKTAGAVKQFQKVRGNLSQDGIVGRSTMEVLSKASEEVKKLEREALKKDIEEIVKLEPKKAEELKIEVDPVEIKKLDTLPPLELKIEIEKTMKELRKEKKESRKKKRLLRRLARLQKRERKVQDKINKLNESKLSFISEFDSFDY